VLYLRRDAASAVVSRLRSHVASDADVSSVTYVSGAEGFRRWKRMVSGPVRLIPPTKGNPFEAMLVVGVRDSSDLASAVRYAKASVDAPAAVDTIVWGSPGY